MTPQDVNVYDALPTVHVLYWRKIEEANPLIPAMKEDVTFYHENSSLIRSSLVEHIAKHYVSNDHLLAEYILLNLISRTVSTKDDILIGHFPLNIRGQFNNYKVRELYELLSPYALNICLNIKFGGL